MGESELAGVARVDALLFEPLEGLKRPRGVSAERHEKALKRLRAALAYMSAPALEGMRDLIARHAPAGVWPEEGLVRAWAFTLELPPPRSCDYAASLMRSEMGRRAWAEGWGVELFQVAKRLGPPPGRYIIRELVAESDRNRRRVYVIEDDLERGAEVEPARLAWLEQYRRDRQEVEGMMRELMKGSAE